MFLTARTDPITVDAAFAADDFVAKPIVAAELMTRIVNRLERVDRFRQLADLDQLTGVPNRRGAEPAIEELLLTPRPRRRSSSSTSITSSR